MAQMDGEVSYCFWEICSKNTGLQGSVCVYMCTISQNGVLRNGQQTECCEWL